MRSQASEAFEMSSRKKICLLEYSERASSSSRRLTSALKLLDQPGLVVAVFEREQGLECLDPEQLLASGD